jgi:hypothetical protein
MRRLSVVLLVAVAVAGCKKQEPPAAPQAAAGQPAAAPGAEAGTAIAGKVLEKLDAPPYSYLKVQSAKGEVWAAVPKSDVAVGAEVNVGAAMPMEKFESKTLGRTFDLVYFGTLGGDAPAQAAAPGMPPGGMPPGAGDPKVDPAQMAAQHAGISKAPTPAEIGDVKVPKASGADARTVAELYAQKASLKEKPVTIRGKVVKYNAGIMGKNWIHLRDGTGTAGKDNDITVTTMDAAAVGDVVVVKGTVRVDKDFGSGYAYPVIVEDAKVSK